MKFKKFSYRTMSVLLMLTLNVVADNSFGELKDSRSLLCMGTKEKNLEGATIKLNYCDGADERLWLYDKETGLLKIKKNTNYCLTSDGFANGYSLRLKGCNSSNIAQQWKVDEDKKIIYLEKYPQLVVDAYDNKLDAKVGLWTYHGGNNQRWSVENIISPNTIYRDIPTLFPSHTPTSWSNSWGFAALKNDNTVVTWGLPVLRGDASSLDLTNVKTVYSTLGAFAALKNDGSVVTWGDSQYGGDSAEVRQKLGYGVKTISSTFKAFAALKYDGSVVAWGFDMYGGNTFSVNHELHNVKTIYSNGVAFAALKEDGTVVTWGEPLGGGDMNYPRPNGVLTGVKFICSTSGAFAALKSDGSVITWGMGQYGGDSSAIKNSLTNVKAIFSNRKAFVALKKDGTVVSWGDSQYGGDSSGVQNQLKNVKTIYSSGQAFTALRSDGTVVSWGEIGDISLMNNLKDVKVVYSTDKAFAALRNNGTVITWGVSQYGGDSSKVAWNLRDIKAIYSTQKAFAALKNDGSVVTWGDMRYGGDSSSVNNYLKNVKTIYSNSRSFVALRNDNTVVVWGWSNTDDEVYYNNLQNVKKVFPSFTVVNVKEEKYGELKDSRSSYCMSAYLNQFITTPVILNKCNGSDASLWMYDETSGLIKNKRSKEYCLAIEYSLDSGRFLHLKKCNSSDKLQKWDVNYNTNIISARETSKNIVVDAYGQYIGSRVGVWTYHGGSNQRWSVANLK